MSAFQPIYKNEAGLEIPGTLVEVQNTLLVEIGGQTDRFEKTIHHKTLGVLTHDRMEPVPQLPPQPYDPQREALLSRLDELLRRIPDYEKCLNRHPSVRRAVDKRFVSLSTEAIEQLSFLVEDETERQAREAKAAEPPPRFKRYDLTISFRGQMIGDLFVDEIYELGTAANGWNTRWLCHCTGCEQGEPASRVISSQTILQMKVGYTPKYVCEKPCRKKGKK